jgi:hypothetical protein
MLTTVEKEDAINAINDVGLLPYGKKSWNNEDFLIIFLNGLEKTNLMKRLDEKIAEINKACGGLQEL